MTDTPDVPTLPTVARCVSGGFLAPRIRRIAALSGVSLRPGWPRAGEAVAIWGHAGTSARAEWVARKAGAPVLRFEDAPLRSLHPGRMGEPPLGLVMDTRAAPYDGGHPSDLERILATHPFDDGALIAGAREAMGAFARSGVTKYAATVDAPPPAPGYVLVIDQTRGDASIRLGGASETTFREMVLLAREEHPGTRIVVKTHPETARGLRPGHYGPADAVHGAVLETRPLAPAALFAGAVAVYTVSSQMGFEAIVHGHRPVVFGQPFYCGWGLTDDRNPVDRRQRRLTRVQLFAGAMVLHPRWYDPHADALCGPADIIRILEARARAWREDREGWSAPGMRLWKRAHLRRFLSGNVRFRPDRLRRTLVWGDRPADDPDAVRIEDGFLRSRGLGAELVPPLSLVLDPEGIYYDPTRPSALERAVINAAARPPQALDRARRLREAVVALGVTKYNLDASPLPDLPEGRRIVLVPGQVADDASLRHGAGPVRDNAALLRAAREADPDAFIVYKPHPDVEAGLREGAIDAGDADLVAAHAAPVPLIGAAHAVWTMTSLLGFEALIRGVPVTCLGAPFYAGWGLTDDRGPVPARRRAARPSLDALVHGSLIAYPRYFDPVTGTACPAEVALRRLTEGRVPHPGPANRLLSKAQGAVASQAWLWR
ncbi:capsular polysaccharide biosynthesis protein [Jannaschia sp. W003]|uniref:capsular polysaccharide biosynthesis protein n=1 Tax=Jannaschia sp. W003 TaxID=2867012 RepID=UPI0021A74064|nr:capsular polysaccharide biosynthesis protein [Jannaschia sp. W003]UWQ20059.1 capsular polysaccharide biosynthesis protein [Jannaschia sp. W003]